MTTVGTGTHSYDVISDWAKVPDGWNAPMAAVTVDSQDRIYGFNRGEHGIIVFDKDGNYLSGWGETDFEFPTPYTQTAAIISGSLTGTPGRFSSTRPKGNC